MQVDEVNIERDEVVQKAAKKVGVAADPGSVPYEWDVYAKEGGIIGNIYWSPWDDSAPNNEIWLSTRDMTTHKTCEEALKYLASNKAVEFTVRLEFQKDPTDKQRELLQKCVDEAMRTLVEELAAAKLKVTVGGIAADEPKQKRGKKATAKAK